MSWKFEKEFREAHPETIGETDKEFDLDNYKDWLEQELVNKNALLADVSNSNLNPKVSPRCGKGSCEHYDKTNKESKCSKYSDRRLCSLSNKQRLKSANHSKKRGDTQNHYCC